MENGSKIIYLNRFPVIRIYINVIHIQHSIMGVRFAPKSIISFDCYSTVNDANTEINGEYVMK